MTMFDQTRKDIVHVGNSAVFGVAALAIAITMSFGEAPVNTAGPDRHSVQDRVQSHVSTNATSAGRNHYERVEAAERQETAAVVSGVIAGRNASRG